MCIAIAIFAGKQLEEDIARKCWNSNSDGAGFCFVDGSKVRIKKGFMTFDDFWNEYSRWDLHNRPHLIHFRIQTSGKTDRMNTHPWRVTSDMAMIHNGMLQFPSTPKLSDTGNFVKKFLRPVAIHMGSSYVMWNEALHQTIEPMMRSSKLVFLDANEHISILNSKAGNWENPVMVNIDGKEEKRYERWFSNTSYKWGRPDKTTPTSRETSFFGKKLGDYECVPSSARWPGGVTTSAAYLSDKKLEDLGWIRYQDGSWDAPKGWIDPDEKSKSKVVEFDSRREESGRARYYDLDEHGNLVDEAPDLDDEAMEEWERFNAAMEKECLECMANEDEKQTEKDAKYKELAKHHILRDGYGISYSQRRCDVAIELHYASGLSWFIIEGMSDQSMMAAAEEFGIFDTIH